MINSFDHIFIKFEEEGARYFICKQCSIIVFISDLYDKTYKISTINKCPTLEAVDLNFTCNEWIIKKLLE